jgi:hypothetical protein
VKWEKLVGGRKEDVGVDDFDHRSSDEVIGVVLRSPASKAPSFLKLKFKFFCSGWIVETISFHARNSYAQSKCHRGHMDESLLK